MKRADLIALAIAGGTLIAAIGVTGGRAAADQIVTLCPTEDSTDCVWIASEQGNQRGHSFVNIGGDVHYLN